MIDSVPAFAADLAAGDRRVQHRDVVRREALGERARPIGWIVLMSITSEPAAAPSATPASPNSTSSTSGVSGSIVITTSERRPSSAGVEARAAPSPTSSSTGGAERECTVSG